VTPDDVDEWIDRHYSVGIDGVQVVNVTRRGLHIPRMVRKNSRRLQMCGGGGVIFPKLFYSRGPGTHSGCGVG